MSPPCKQQRLSRPTGAGDGSVFLSACGILVLATSAAYDPKRSAYGRRNGTAVMHAALHAAQANGYTRRDTFLMVASAHAGQEPMHPSVVELAHEVIALIPAVRIPVVLATLDLAFELDATDWRHPPVEPSRPDFSSGTGADAQTDLKPRPGRGRPRKSTTLVSPASGTAERQSHPDGQSAQAPSGGHLSTAKQGSAA